MKSTISTSQPAWLRRIGLALVAALLGVALVACGADQTADTVTPLPGEGGLAQQTPLTDDPLFSDDPMLAPTPDPGAPQGLPMDPGAAIVALTPGQIAATPGNYMGEQVVVQGAFDLMVSERSFILREPGQTDAVALLVIGADETVRTPNPGELAPQADATANIEVIGTVRPFDQAALANELDYAFDSAEYAAYTGGLVIVADSLRRITSAEVGLPDPRVIEGDIAAEGLTQIADITTNPQFYIDQTVQVTGRVGELLAPNAFRLTENNVLATGPELLVVIAAGTQLPELAAGDRVQIAGTVRSFERSEVEANLGAALTEDQAATLVDQPTLVTSDLSRRANVSDLAGNPDFYLGDRVTILGAVSAVLDEQSFLLNDEAFVGEGDLLVVLEGGTTALAAGDIVYVTGVARPFAEVAAGTAQLQEPPYVGIADRPAIVADTVLQITR